MRMRRARISGRSPNKADAASCPLRSQRTSYWRLGRAWTSSAATAASSSTSRTSTRPVARAWGALAIPSVSSPEAPLDTMSAASAASCRARTSAASSGKVARPALHVKPNVAPDGAENRRERIAAMISRTRVAALAPLASKSPMTNSSAPTADHHVLGAERLLQHLAEGERRGIDRRLSDALHRLCRVAVEAHGDERDLVPVAPGDLDEAVDVALGLAAPGEAR